MIKRHSTQNSIQIEGILKVLQQIITDDFPLALEIDLQSDNAQAYSASENLCFIYQLNFIKPYLTPITRWINSEAHKGKTNLNCHFSYLGQQFRELVEAGHDIVKEEDI